MTTQITVKSTLICTREVHVRIKDKVTGEIYREKILRDGESGDFVVFDDGEIIISEIDKERY